MKYGPAQKELFVRKVVQVRTIANAVFLGGLPLPLALMTWLFSGIIGADEVGEPDPKQT